MKDRRVRFTTRTVFETTVSGDRLQEMYDRYGDHIEGVHDEHWIMRRLVAHPDHS